VTKHDDQRPIWLERFSDVWPDDDPDANFKREVSEYTRADPMPTVRQLAEHTGIPVGALVRYVLVKWTAEGSEALMALGPRMLQRLWTICEHAEAEGTDTARLEAYRRLHDLLSWLCLPLSGGNPSSGQADLHPDHDRGIGTDKPL
jgi:hypothetical protein